MQQQQQTLKIQRRYWQFVFERMQLEQQWIDEVLKIRGSAAQLPNMDAVDAALAELLLRSQGEAREAILSHLTRLYYRVAADCPDIVSRWGKLFRDIDVRAPLFTKLKLWLLHSFHIRPDGKLFSMLKRKFSPERAAERLALPAGREFADQPRDHLPAGVRKQTPRR